MTSFTAFAESNERHSVVISDDDDYCDNDSGEEDDNSSSSDVGSNGNSSNNSIVEYEKLEHSEPNDEDAFEYFLRDDVAIASIAAANSDKYSEQIIDASGKIIAVNDTIVNFDAFIDNNNGKKRSRYEEWLDEGMNPGKNENNKKRRR